MKTTKYEKLTQHLTKAAALSTELRSEHETHIQEVLDGAETELEDDRADTTAGIIEGCIEASYEIYVIAKESPATALAYAQGFLASVETSSCDPRGYVPNPITVQSYVAALAAYYNMPLIEHTDVQKDRESRAKHEASGSAKQMLIEAEWFKSATPGEIDAKLQAVWVAGRKSVTS